MGEMCDDEVIDFAGEAQEDGRLLMLGSTAEGAADANHEGTCGGAGRDQVIRFEAPESGTWRFTTGEEATPFDTVLYARSSCLDEESEIACNDDTVSGDLQSTVSIDLEAGELTYLYVDAYSADGGGEFGLSARRLDEIAVGGICDPTGAANICAEGSFCQSGPDAIDGVCAVAEAPSVLGGVASLEETVLRMRVDGADANGDASVLILALLDADGEAINLAAEGEEPLLSAEIDASEQAAGLAEFSLAYSFELEAAQAAALASVSVTLVDAQGLTSDASVIALADRPVVEVGGECDGVEISNICAEGAFCYTAPVDGVFPDMGVCTAATAPVLDTLSAFANGDLLTIVANGSDTTRDVVGIRLSLINAQDEVITFDDGTGNFAEATFEFGPSEPVYGQEQVEIVLPISGLSEFPETVSIRAAFIDSANLDSNEITAALEALPVVADGDPCDPEGVINTCGGQSSCESPEEGADPICVAPVIPVFVEGEAFYNATTAGMGLEVTATADSEIIGVEFVLLDSAGEIIPINGSVESFFITFDDVQQPEEGGAYVGTTARLLPEGLEDVTSIRFSVVDGDDIESAEATLAFAASPTVESGAACDLIGAFNSCPAEELCIDGDPEPTCQVPTPACPDEWTVTDLNALQAGDVWTADGDTTGEISLTQGTCGGGSGQNIYSFVAPAAGTYLISTSSVDENADTVLYVRDFCGLDAPTAELSCNDDDPNRDGLMSALELELDADQQIFIFVDGYFDALFGGIGWQGSYILTISQP